MNKPQVNFIPLREAVSSDSVTNLDLIVRITTPKLENTKPRPALNLGLVIDHSGSMGGKKIEYAKKAACYAVEQLTSNDRVSVTIYDDKVEVIVPSTLAAQKEVILNKIKQIVPRGTTALHDGWIEGGKQVSQYLKPEQLNRVILLSDGLANVGETNPDVIASNVHGLSQHGVSTTTMGIGDNYNEDLMEAMANSGDGNYYYIEDPEQLESIFANELLGIKGTIGQKVSIGIKPLGTVELVDVFNDLDQTEYGNYKLPNLIAGNTIDVVLRLKIPPLTEGKSLVKIRLAYDNPETQSREDSYHYLELPVLNSIELNELPFNDEVREKVSLLLATRARYESVRNLDRGDFAMAREVLREAREDILGCYDAPSPMLQREIDELDDLDKDLEDEKIKQVRKRANYQGNLNRNSRRNQ